MIHHNYLYEVCMRPGMRPGGILSLLIIFSLLETSENFYCRV